MDDRQRAAGAYRKNQGLIKVTDSHGTVGRIGGERRNRGEKGDGSKGSDSGRGHQRTEEFRTDVRAEERRPPSPTDREREVAQLLALVGREEAASILKYLPREQAELLLKYMSRLDSISPSDARKVLGKFGTQHPEIRRATAAGPETAREILIRAFGAQDGEARFYRMFPDQRPARFSFLADADGHQLSVILREESTATVAIVVSQVPQVTAARLLEALPQDRSAAIVRRVARLKEVDDEVISTVEQSLRSRLSGLGNADEAVDGEGRLAEILRYLDLATSDAILSSLQEEEPATATHVRQRLSTVEDVLDLDPRDLQAVLQQVDDVDLAIIVKGVPETVGTRLLENVSERRAKMVGLQRESLGVMRRKDVDRVIDDFMKGLRERVRSGEVRLSRGYGEWV